MATTKRTQIKILKLVLCAYCALLANITYASGGDGGLSENVFAPEYHVPKADIADYAIGNLGVLQKSYWRVYQFLAYRALTNHALTNDQVASLNIEGWQVGTTNQKWDYAYDTKANGVSSWLSARQIIKGTPEIKDLSVQREVGNYYNYYINCSANALELAASTLKTRLEQHGEDLARQWLAGQDAVFANCSGQHYKQLDKVLQSEVTGPPKLENNAPKWLIDDRAYQTAAAYFYREKFDEARAGFQAIAKNKQSPWHTISNYLAARCLIRQATLQYQPAAGTLTAEQHEAATKTGKALLSLAKKELLLISKTYPPAKQLITYIDAQLDPSARLATLGKLLASSEINADTPQQLTDYLLLLDRAETNAAIKPSKDPMTKWIAAMQGYVVNQYDSGEEYDKKLEKQRQTTVELAREQWQKDQNSATWLVPMVIHAKVGELKAEEMKAIDAIAVTSPAYQTMQYHLARLSIAENKLNDADDIVTKMLTQYSTSMNIANKNRWLALKVVAARTLAEYLQALPRQYAEEFSAVPIPNEAKQPAKAPTIGFDNDYDQHLYHDFSLAELNGLLVNKDFPAQYDNKTLKETMWARAIILEDFETAKNLTDGLMQGRDTTKHLFERFKNAQTDDEKRLVAMLIFANVPELSLYGNPYVWSDSSCFNKGDCKPQTLNFLQASAVEAAKVEHQKLYKYSIENDYIAPALLAWAKQKPKDPEAPKALHFFVYRKNYGQKPDTKLAREAFRLLHNNYPNSEWASKTKYFY